MTSFDSVFLRAIFALALLGTGIAGPQVLPAVAGETCNIAKPRAGVQSPERAPAAAASTRPARAVVVAARD